LFNFSFIVIIFIVIPTAINAPKTWRMTEKTEQYEMFARRAGSFVETMNCYKELA